MTGPDGPFFRKHSIGVVEHRQDPLSGGWTRINPDRARRVKHTGDADLQSLIKSSRAGCPFCPENIETATPGFPPEIFPESRPRKGSSTLVLNKDPFGENHAVGILSDAHFIPMEAYRAEILLDAMDLCQRFFHQVSTLNPSARFPILVWNFLPPSAGSIVHPHTQLLMESGPAPIIEALTGQCERWEKRTGEPYWERLLHEESRAGARIVWRNETLAILASFAPRGFREILFVLPGSGSLAGLKPKEQNVFCRALVRALKAYQAMGVGSFNLVTYSCSADADPPPFPFHARLISRPYPSGIYTNDTGFFERMYDLWIIDTFPEEVAARARPFFEQFSG